MSLSSTLSLRIAAILLLGFVVFQVAIAVVSVPTHPDDARALNLPRPIDAAAIAQAFDRTPPSARDALARALQDSVYSLELREAAPAPLGDPRSDLTDVAVHYAAAMPGRVVRLDGRLPRFGQLIGGAPRPARFFPPLRLAVALRGGGWILFTSQPSPALRALLRSRSLIGAAGGVMLLAALLLAVRQTARPLVRLAREVGGWTDARDMPDLPMRGPPEVRALAGALNILRARVRELLLERTRMLAGIAHDLRTYLTRMRLRVEFIDDPDQRARATRDLAAMSALLDDTLFFARADALSGASDADSGADSTAAARLRFDAAAELGLLVAARQELGEPVTLDGPTHGLFLHASPTALRRIADNLIDNALRHAGAARVSIGTEGEAMRLDVVDDGPGVAPGDLDTLGRPFHRLDAARDSASGGAGLGLAIVRALAARNGGSARFANGAAGGFAATILLPLAPAAMPD